MALAPGVAITSVPDRVATPAGPTAHHGLILCLFSSAFYLLSYGSTLILLVIQAPHPN